MLSNSEDDSVENVVKLNKHKYKQKAVRYFTAYIFGLTAIFGYFVKSVKKQKILFKKVLKWILFCVKKRVF